MIRSVESYESKLNRQAARRPFKASDRTRGTNAKSLAWSAAVKKRDGYRCRLLRLLTFSDIARARKTWGSLGRLEAAHIVGRGRMNVKKVKYDIENGVTLHQAFHRALELLLDPVTGERISAERRDEWFAWIRHDGGLKE